MTGTREAGLKASESPQPIQILSREVLQTASGKPDLMNTLAQIVPSLTVQAFGGDMAGQTLEWKLRGLSPNHVLVLVNGKRRHTTANLAVDLGSPFQGGAGVDLNFIPLEAIDHIEILMDGAAAQYGTDAIAGVINIILKKNSSGGALGATTGRYFDGGGNTGYGSLNLGLEPTDHGFLNVTGELHYHGHSDRSAPDPRVIDPMKLATYPDSNEPSVPGYPYLDLVNGDAEYHLKIASINSGFQLGGGVELYAFGSYGDKRAASYENYRTPDTLSYTNPSTGITTYPFPFGFTPQEATDEDDYSLTGGVKGSFLGWNWDVSSSYGADSLDLYTSDSANAGTYAINGLPTPANYYDGRLKATQWTSTIDVNRDFDVDLAGPLNVAYGVEYRRETYLVSAGTPASYIDGGAQAYPGFTPQDAGTHDRKNVAAYLDLAGRPIEGMLIDAAVRHEHYSDFGSATAGKVSGRYDVASGFAIRGTVSNGFRAPTLAEEYYSATNVAPTSAFAQLAPNSPGGKLLGLSNGLEPEKSVNYSLGFVLHLLPSISATLDFYQITVTNRIVGSGSLYGSIGGVVQSQAVNNALAANGNKLDPAIVATGITGINVFLNGIDTRTRGADLGVDISASRHLDFSIRANYNDIAVTRIPATPALLAGQTLFDAQAISDLTTANPKYVINLGAHWTAGRMRINLLEKIYGASSEWENDYGANPTGLPEYFKSTIGVTPITNLDLAYQLTKGLTLSTGAINLFNRYPPKYNSTLLAHYDNFAYLNFTGPSGAVPYPTFSPFGINGGYYYARFWCTF